MCRPHVVDILKNAATPFNATNCVPSLKQGASFNYGVEGAAAQMYNIESGSCIYFVLNTSL